MFAGFGYRLAKKRLLAMMKSQGIIPNEKAKAMGLMLGNRSKHDFGAMLVRSNVASNKYAAVAVACARLVVAASRNPKTDVSYPEWE